MLHVGDLIDAGASDLSDAFRDAVHPMDIGFSKLSAMSIDWQGPADLNSSDGNTSPTLIDANDRVARFLVITR